MTRRQKWIVAALAFADIIVILALIVLGTSRNGASTVLPPTPTDRPENHTLSSVEASPVETPQHGGLFLLAVRRSTCEWKAAQLLAQAGLGGTVVLSPGGSLCFNITFPLVRDHAIDQAAQSAWTAFDIALILNGSRTCDSFTQVEITIMAEGDQTDTRISASASTMDLVAFDAGELSEAEFIERVTYATTRLP